MDGIERRETGRLMRKIADGVKELWRSKAFALILSLSALCAYGFAVTHLSIGMDDTAVGLYYEEGLAAYVGRWSIFVLNKILPVDLAALIPWMTELCSVLLLMLSATLWCALWKSVCEPKISIPFWGYGVVAGVFITCPLISEVFVFYLHNGICTGYGMVALALACLTKCMKPDLRHREKIGQMLLSAALLAVAAGFYESFVLVYIMGAITVFFLNRVLHGKTGTEGEISTRVFPWAGWGAAVILVTMAVRAIILAIVNTIFKLDGFEIYNVKYRKVFGDIFTVPGELAMVLKRFLVKYYINALTYLPIAVLVVALLLIGAAAVWLGIRKKDGILPVCFGALVLLPVVMSMIEGLVTRYRSAQYVPVISAFGIFLLLSVLYHFKAGRLIRYAFGFSAAVLLFNQCMEMNKWFYADWLKYQNVKEVMEQIAYDLKKEADTSKPIVFRGAYEVPYSISKDSYVGFSSWQYRLISRLTDPIDEHLKEKFHGKYGYASPEMPLVSTLQWGVTAFDGTSWQLIKFWEMHGIEGFSCETNLDSIEEAEKIRSSENMPGYPENGYIKECEDYIIVNLAQ